MTEIEDVLSIIIPFITDGTSKFYGCFIDNNLLVIIAENVSQENSALNKFNKNLHFTVAWI